MQPKICYNVKQSRRLGKCKNPRLLKSPGFAERINEAHLQGQQEGLEKGTRQTSYEHILDILVTRFNPPVTQYRQIERQLDTIQDVEKLRELLLALVQTEDVAEFEQVLAQASE